MNQNARQQRANGPSDGTSVDGPPATVSAPKDTAQALARCEPATVLNDISTTVRSRVRAAASGRGAGAAGRRRGVAVDVGTRARRRRDLHRRSRGASSVTPPPVTPMHTQRVIPALGQRVRVDVRHGTGVPLVICNGIGASLEVLDPLVEQLNPDTPVVRFDVPGTGGSPNSPLPYGFPYLAAVLGRLLTKLGFAGRQVDILGLSWGGALAQQFTFQNPRRCRRLILVSTGMGIGMVPAKPTVLAKMATPRRFVDHEYAASVAAELYGGNAGTNAPEVKALFARQSLSGSRVGYVHQLLAGSVWTSAVLLPLIRQRTLIIAGTNDPIIPVANAHIMARLLPHATLHLHDGGHIDLVTNAGTLTPVIETFRQ